MNGPLIERLIAARDRLRPLRMMGEESVRNPAVEATEAMAEAANALASPRPLLDPSDKEDDLGSCSSPTVSAGEVEARIQEAKVLIGARNDRVSEAERESNINRAWWILDALAASPAPSLSAPQDAPKPLPPINTSRDAGAGEVPEGWALVPIKVTREMKEAVRANGGDQAVAYALAAWPDLLEAAPEAPRVLLPRETSEQDGHPPLGSVAAVAEGAVAKPGDKLRRCLVDLVHMVAIDNIGELHLELDDMVTGGVNRGNWTLDLKHVSPTPERALLNQKTGEQEPIISVSTSPVEGE